MKRLGDVRGRVARPASVGWNIAKTLAQSLTMWLIFFFLADLAGCWCCAVHAGVGAGVY